MLFILFIALLLVAQGLYVELFGTLPSGSIPEFFNNVRSTDTCRSLILWGNGVGFLFAAVVPAMTVVAFPLLLDRDIGAIAAIDTSVRLTPANPTVTAAWGVIVAVLLVSGAFPFFADPAVVMPILGHATWHLYRSGVAS